MSTRPDEARRAFWQEQFARAASPGAWWLSARRLMKASELLWDPVAADLDAMMHETTPAHMLKNLDVGQAWMLLIGVALENLAKAVLLKKNPALAQPERLPKWPGNGHDLSLLFSEAGIPLQPEERDFLGRPHRVRAVAGPLPDAHAL